MTFKEFVSNIFTARSWLYLMPFLKMRGTLVGSDSLGNTYYTSSRLNNAGQPRRYVIYADQAEASAVPPEWHAWLHYQVDSQPEKQNPFRRLWQKEHKPNPTGTAQATLPKGHVLNSKPRQKATGDYHAWAPQK